MKFKKPTPKRKAPETEAAKRLRTVMEENGWYVKKLHGSIYQSGLPDLLATHKYHGIKLIETKLPKGSKLTQAQIVVFKKLQDHGTGVYILHDERDYKRLFDKPNWTHYAMWGLI